MGKLRLMQGDRPPGGHSIHRHARQKSPEVHDRPLGGIYFSLGSQHMYPFIYWFSKDTWWTHQILLFRVCKSESQAHASTRASAFSLWDSQRLGYGLLGTAQLPAPSPFQPSVKLWVTGNRPRKTTLCEGTPATVSLQKPPVSRRKRWGGQEPESSRRNRFL